MIEASWADARRVVIVAVVEIVALVTTAYVGFVAFLLLPPGVGGASRDSTIAAALAVIALGSSVVLPSAGFLCAAFFWRDRVWLYRAAGACGVMGVFWLLLFLVRLG